MGRLGRSKRKGQVIHFEGQII